MESSIYAPWLQQAVPESPHHPVHHSPPPQQWPKQGQQQPAPSAASPQPSHQPPSIDLADFTTLADHTAASSSTTSAASPSSAQSGFSFYPGFYGAGASSYYSSWATPQASQSPDPLPLSNYSTLNGATSTNTASSSQPSNANMMIDPTLTTMNGSTSNGTHHSYPQQPNYSAQTSTQPQRQYYLGQFPISYYLPQQQQQQQQQGTLSPHALHAPTTNSLANAYYSQPHASGPKPPLQHQPQPQTPQIQQVQQQPAPPPGLTPQERKAAMLNTIRPLLQPNSFTGAGAVLTLLSRLVDYGAMDVDAATRLEILTKIRDGAGNHYFRAWVENQTAVDITRDWLKAAFTASREDGDDALVETIMPLLHIIDRLPMTVDTLKASKLGKLIVKLVKDPPTPAIKDMASNVERRWRQLVTEKGSEGAVDGDVKLKKRKLNDPPARSGPPLKKAAVGGVKPVVRKDPPTASLSKPAAKDAKSDSSFFSAPKPKPKLPSFRKAPPAPPSGEVKKEESNIAQPSAIDPFQEVLKSMKTRKGSPLAGVSAPSPAGGNESSTSVTPLPGYTRLGKRKKTVTWAPDGKLESIRIIERAIYGDENTDGGVYSSHSLRDLDRNEGAAMHMHLFEEAVDWTEPLLLEMPADLSDQERGSDSKEKTTQEQREQTALVSLYMSPSSIPDSPAEASQTIPDEEVDKDVREMTTGPEVDQVFWSGPPIPLTPTPPQPGSPPLSSSVADLVGQLAGGVDVAHAHPVDPMIQALPPEQLQQLLVQLTQLGQTPQQQQQIIQVQQQQQLQQPQLQQQSQPSFGDWSGLNQFSTDYSQATSFQEDSGERNGWPSFRGGRGRGRGRGRGGMGGPDDYRHNKRKQLCNFFAAGRCKYGDQCDYSHDMAGSF
ncbi:hypothetical protein GGX14DRAFT_416895 [Mycena pura]|uniref:Serine/threonine-protein phosphatase 1 regulatory subunit 10 n=1 Tax=Mycena pura TaxID=153505 RepID=A0AAD7E5T9_9AGAR|nr:hypothetical protein GGX14DRAFT_416895 [Mycena pura]